MAHLQRSHQKNSSPLLGRWLLKLVSMEMKPTIQILEECQTIEGLDEAERRWIRHFRSIGNPLKNSNDGGRVLDLSVFSRKSRVSTKGKKRGRYPIVWANCKVCGQRFPARNNDANYCGTPCWLEGIKVIKTCVICGCEFRTNRDATTCGGSCSTKLAWQHSGLRKKKGKKTPCHPKTCEVCCADFMAKNIDARFCTIECAHSKRIPAVCIVCGHNFLQTASRPAKTCSLKCGRSLVDNSVFRRTTNPRTCMICGHIFIHGHSKAKTCSHECLCAMKSMNAHARWGNTIE